MIKLNNIVKSYKIENQEFHALDGANLEVKEGEMIAIMGPSGSGKSTMLNIIGGMDKASSGDYWFNDIKVSELSTNALHRFRRNNVSFVFQHFALMNQYTVYQNVEVPLISQHVGTLKRRKIIMEQLKRLGIENQAKKYPLQLSGGQQQRCSIARALAANNKLILADEPTGALDLATGEEMMKIFQEIRDEGKTIIVITHDTNIASKCERTIRIEDGKIL